MKNESPDLSQENRSSIIKKKKRVIAVPEEHKVKTKESLKRNKKLGLARELKKILQREDDSDTKYYWSTWNIPQKLEKRTGRV